MDNFTSEITEISAFYKPEGTDTVSCNITVKWYYEMEMRNWGLKGASIGIKDISGSLLYTFIDDRPGEEIDIKSLGFEIDTEGLDDRKLIDDVCPQSVEINYKDKTITVNF